MINSVVELMTWLDDEMGDESRCEGIEKRFRIRIIRIKCRFSLPTSGKLMRIRIFIYLPPKAGFNWRGPARR